MAFTAFTYLLLIIVSYQKNVYFVIKINRKKNIKKKKLRKPYNDIKTNGLKKEKYKKKNKKTHVLSSAVIK